jgi:PAS domain S-box-containing protein
MNEKRKTKAQLLEELAALRQQIAELTARESHHRQTEEALQAAKDYAETLINSSLDMIISVDRDRRIMEFNPAAEKTFGYRQAEVLGQPVDLLYADPAEGVRIAAQILREGGFRGEITNRRKDGEIFYSYLSASQMYDAAGKMIGVMGISRDITEYKRTEAALRESEEKYRDLVENVTELIYVVDEKGVITYISPVAKLLGGYDPATLVGHSFTEFVHPEDLPVLIESFHKTLAGELHPSEYRLLTVSGEPIWVRSASRPIFRGERVVGLRGVITDITDRKRVESELAQQRAEFLAMLTHDIRTPLGAILACAELVLEEINRRGLTEEKDLLERLRGNVLTIDSLVTNYLDFSRIEAGHLTLNTTPLAINDILCRVKQHYDAEARRRDIVLECPDPAESPVVEGDPLALERIFANLVHNALKFTPAGGRVTVSSLRQDREVVVSVRDTGTGIAPQELPFLFEKYRRGAATHHRQGTGLGLFIVKALIESHGGRVQADSTLGNGTCLTVYLPLASQQ